jgi:hypothetical protein
MDRLLAAPRGSIFPVGEEEMKGIQAMGRRKNLRLRSAESVQSVHHLHLSKPSTVRSLPSGNEQVVALMAGKKHGLALFLKPGDGHFLPVPVFPFLLQHSSI